jgi:DNA repair exonuclease SbcCD ATPase subunit
LEEEVKKYLLGLIPKKAAMLRERHRECSEKYPSFWEIFPERFAKKFETEPEKTLERFLKLGDEECAWEKGDFRTRSILLDNFIGREIARELKLELDKIRDITPNEKPSAEEVLLQENIRLKKERDRLQERLSACEEEREGLERQVRELEEDLREDGARRKAEEELAQLERKLREGEEKAEELERYARSLEERLKHCLQKREPKKLARMARILELGSEVGGFVPLLMARRLGIKLHMVYEYLRELAEIGMVERVSRGYYRVREKPGENIEEELAKRLAQARGEGVG